MSESNRPAAYTLELGVGAFNWPRCERVSDRYGRVMLLNPQETSGTFDALDRQWWSSADFATAPVGAHGQLIAEVIEPRRSDHIGDLFRGIYPPKTPPAAGTVYELGTGALFLEPKDGYPCVGVRPADERATDWLDPRALYDLHNCTVRLSFLEVRDAG